MKTWVDWHPKVSYWVEDDAPDPDVHWPDDWEGCSWPDVNPLVIREDLKRPGTSYLALPMYHVRDRVAELDLICGLLERMPEAELAKWLALPYRELQFGCSEPEIDAADMNTRGFAIPGPLLARVRRLGLRLIIGFYPAGPVENRPQDEILPH